MCAHCVVKKQTLRRSLLDLPKLIFQGGFFRSEPNQLHSIGKYLKPKWYRIKSGTYPIGYSRICPRKWNKKAVEKNPRSYMGFPFSSLCEVNFCLDFGLKRSYKTWDEQDLAKFIGVYYVCHKSMRRNICVEVASIYINPLEHT